MRTPIRFRAETKYTESAEKKANTNLPIMATVGNHLTGAAAVAGRPGWYHIRLGGETVASPNPSVASRLTQCKAEGVGLILNDLIFVVKARDRNLTHYEFHSFIQNTAGTSPYPAGIIIPDNVNLAYFIQDDGAAAPATIEYVRIDTTNAQPTVIFNDGEIDVDFRVAVDSTIFLTDPTHAFSLQGSTGAVSMGTAPDANAHLLIYNAIVSTINQYYGLWTWHQKTLGASDENDPMHGLDSTMAMNHAGVIGHMLGGRYHSWLRAGTIGAAGQAADLIGIEAEADGDAGTVYGSAIGVNALVTIDGTVFQDDPGTGHVYGIRSVVDLNAGTIDGNVYGAHVWVDDDIGAGGTVYMLYLDEQTGIDYGIYQSGSADNYLGGNLAVADGIEFTGASGVNIITIPDNFADALHIIDDGAGDVFFRIITTTGSEEVIFNDGEDDVNFRIKSDTFANAFYVDGAAGGITVGGPSMTVPDGWILGIGPALERIVFNAAGYVSVMGANFGVGTLTPQTLLSLGGAVVLTIGTDSVDGADGRVMRIASCGGAAASNRGAYLDFSGNEHASAGSIGFVAGTAAGPIFFYTGAVTTERMRILGNGNVGIATAVPGQIFDINAGSGNMIADGYDNHPSWLTNKVDPEPLGDVLAKFKQVIPYQYKRIPYVSAEELAAAGIEEFGEERWNAAFPDGHRGGKLEDCLDPAILAFLDQLGDRLREERRELPEWQRLHYGLAMDDLVDTFPDVLSRDADGDIGGYSLNNYVGLLHACIAELLGRVERLE